MKLMLITLTGFFLSVGCVVDELMYNNSEPDSEVYDESKTDESDNIGEGNDNNKSDYSVWGDYTLGTLPILFINTENGDSIVSKEKWVNANYWIEDSEGGGVGSNKSPLSMTIKGRGNATWEVYEKKPYRIKLSTKQPLLGMKKNKQFVLLALMDDFFISFLNYPVAFEFSKRIGLGWTPEIRFVELILNGDYRGLYLLAEKIRVDKDRINIHEQEDGEEDDDKITGGWLLEFDQYEEPDQLAFVEGNGNRLLVTHHSPNRLSDKQHDYLDNLIKVCDRLIYTDDKNNNQWEEYIDIESLAKFYVLQEVMGHREAFMGSTYLYKERGENEKLKFGPLWDMGAWTLGGGYKHFIYEESPYPAELHWIAEIAKFPHFQEVVREIWKSFREQLDVEDLKLDVVNRLETAAENNFKRWPIDRWKGSLLNGKYSFDVGMEAKIEFLESVWNTPTSSVSNNSIFSNNSNIYTLEGRRQEEIKEKGIYIKDRKKIIKSR